MSNSITIYAVQGNSPSEQDFQDLFDDLDELEPFDIKKEELAAHLAALLSYSNETRSGFASKSGWQKSHVTAILNGKRNPTFKTLWEFASYLGYEADLIFRCPDETPARQPWQSKTQSQQICDLNFQGVHEVALDMKSGNHKDF